MPELVYGTSIGVGDYSCGNSVLETLSAFALDPLDLLFFCFYHDRFLFERDN